MSDQVAKTGIVPMPSANDQVEGGHAVMALGYDDVHQWYIVRNSWGSGWGDKGYFYMPYAYMTNNNLCADFWTIRKVA
jgi:C1A family cysteine protease